MMCNVSRVMQGNYNGQKNEPRKQKEDSDSSKLEFFSEVTKCLNKKTERLLKKKKRRRGKKCEI